MSKFFLKDFILKHIMLTMTYYIVIDGLNVFKYSEKGPRLIYSAQLIYIFLFIFYIIIIYLFLNHKSVRHGTF